MVKAKRDVGREILAGILELKRGKAGRVTEISATGRARTSNDLYPASEAPHRAAQAHRDSPGNRISADGARRSQPICASAEEAVPKLGAHAR